MLKQTIYIIRKLAVALVSVMVMTGISSCTRNNGDIGPWFGTWKLTEITVDGTSDAGYEGNIFWKFQNDVFEMVRVNQDDVESYADTHYATWNEDNGYLFVNFRNSDDNNPAAEGEAGNGIYAPFPDSHFIVGGVTQLKIESQSGGDAYLTFTSPVDGKTYGYRLKKQG